MLSGKGMYIWMINQCEQGDIQAIVQKAVDSNLSHVLIKIADNAFPCNQGYDMPLVQALQAAHIQVWGWHYVYGDRPTEEADIAIQRVQALGLDGYVIDAEKEYKHKRQSAITFTQRLRQGLPDTPIALSSFRFPNFHRELPWNEFLAVCDIHMPQVYWVASHDAAAQLRESKRQCDALPNARPYVPTGAIYGAGGWAPTSQDVLDFLEESKKLGLSAANLYSWDYARAHLPHLWQAVSDYAWPTEQTPTPDTPAPAEGDITTQWLEALSARDITRLLRLYDKMAVLQAGIRSYRRQIGLQAWYKRLLKEIPAHAKVQKISAGHSAENIFQIAWKAVTDEAIVIAAAHETFVLNPQGGILLHYTFYEKANGTSPMLPAQNKYPTPM